ncbi:antibiotic biosynthesis monooxygenase family protein [Thermomonospora sp. CIF 1]|uniref:putative quinol monooxygenase n=1 Tax=Thermomonospora sp. CIF 1 TaxID=1916083 RepID=UPI000A9E1F57|nr:antibiotic biosynthesis monooxygenase family protein [Thermomonospora sp. CIF 1]PKK15929.1 MAG: antibiotic biosynthesis monooxygenase [Thermomonospora sp. CIF 1]
MIIVAGWIRLRAGAREDYLAGCRPVIEAARSAPGCLDFTLSADPIDPERINVFERWESDAALEAFRGTGPDEDQTSAIRDAQVNRYRIAAVEPA